MVNRPALAIFEFVGGCFRTRIVPTSQKFKKSHSVCVRVCVVDWAGGEGGSIVEKTG